MSKPRSTNRVTFDLVPIFDGDNWVDGEAHRHRLDRVTVFFVERKTRRRVCVASTVHLLLVDRGCCTSEQVGAADSLGVGGV